MADRMPSWWRWTRSLARALEALRLWETPAEVTQVLLDVHPPPTDAWVIDAWAGRGAIARVLLEAGYSVSAVEVNPAHQAALLRLHNASPHVNVTIGDWLRQHPVQITPGNVDRVVVGNPPWKPSTAMVWHAQHTLLVSPLYAALLLPADALHSRCRSRFWKAHKPQALYLLSERPSYSGNGRNGTQDACWVVWDREMRKRGEQRFEVISWKAAA